MRKQTAKRRFRLRLTVASVAAVALGAVLALPGQATTTTAGKVVSSPPASFCRVAFEARIVSGRDADLSLVGTLVLHINKSGVVRGALKRGPGEGLPAVTVASLRGTLTGHSLKFSAVTQHGTRLSGVGTVTNLPFLRGHCSLTKRTIMASGKLVAPGGGRGVWAAIGGVIAYIGAQSMHSEICGSDTEHLVILADGNVYNCTNGVIYVTAPRATIVS